MQNASFSVSVLRISRLQILLLHFSCGLSLSSVQEPKTSKAKESKSKEAKKNNGDGSSTDGKRKQSVTPNESEPPVEKPQKKRVSKKAEVGTQPITSFLQVKGK